MSAQARVASQKSKVISTTEKPRPKRVTKPVQKSKPKKKSAISSKNDSKRVAVAKAICSITDPFCIGAKGARLPDGLGGSTIAVQLRGLIPLTSTATGSSALVIAPGCPYGFLGAGIAGTVVTWGNVYTTFANTGLFTTYGHNYRIVSAGAICRTTVSMTNAQGYLILSEGIAPAISTTSVLGAFSYAKQTTMSLTAGLEYSWRSTPLGTEATKFVAANTTTTPNTSWSALVIELIGGPGSVDTMMIEYFVNIEFNLRNDQAIAQMAPPPLRANPTVMALANTTHNSAQSFIAGGVEKVESMVASAAHSAISSLEAAAGDALSGAFAFLGLA